jgi:hypothetical protein
MSEKQIPAAGDEVYDIHGRAASYIANSAYGHVVEPIYEHEDDGEQYYGKPETWREVFSSPPTEKLHNEIAALQNRLAIEQASLDAVRKMRRDEDAEYATRTAERKRFAQLQKLDDYIAGKITHFVVVRQHYDDMAITDFESFIKSTEHRYERKLRLLSLCGDSKGNLSWNVDRYSDGSGGDSGYYWPATSYEEALQKAHEWLIERYAELRKADPDRRQKALTYAASAEKIGLTVPDDVAAWVAEMKDSQRQSNLNSARAELEKAQKRLDELEAQ